MEVYYKSYPQCGGAIEFNMELAVSVLESQILVHWGQGHHGTT